MEAWRGAAGGIGRRKTHPLHKALQEEGDEDEEGEGEGIAARLIAARGALIAARGMGHSMRNPPGDGNRIDFEQKETEGTESKMPRLASVSFVPSCSKHRRADWKGGGFRARRGEARNERSSDSNVSTVMDRCHSVSQPSSRPAVQPSSRRNRPRARGQDCPRYVARLLRVTRTILSAAPAATRAGKSTRKAMILTNSSAETRRGKAATKGDWPQKGTKGLARQSRAAKERARESLE
jgi:hypothetical protein